MYNSYVSLWNVVHGSSLIIAFASSNIFGMWHSMSTLLWLVTIFLVTYIGMPEVSFLATCWCVLSAFVGQVLLLAWKLPLQRKELGCI